MPESSGPDVDLYAEGYSDGRKAAWHGLLQQALRELYLDGMGDTPVVQLGRLVSERIDTLRILRRLCEEHGDIEWDDSLYLADIVEKHLGVYLEK